MQRSSSSWKGIGRRFVRSDDSGWTRNGKPASPLRKRSRRRRRSGGSGAQLDGAEQEQKEKKKEQQKEEEEEMKQGRNEKGVVKRRRNGAAGKGREGKPYIGDRSSCATCVPGVPLVSLAKPPARRRVITRSVRRGENLRTCKEERRKTVGTFK